MQGLEDFELLLTNLSETLSNVKTELRKYPPGHLLVTPNGKYYTFLHVYTNEGRRIRKAIGRDKSLVWKLARKAFLKKKLFYLTLYSNLLTEVSKNITDGYYNRDIVKTFFKADMIDPFDDYKILKTLPKFYSNIPKEYLFTEFSAANRGTMPNPVQSGEVPARILELWARGKRPFDSRKDVLNERPEKLPTDKDWFAMEYRQNSFHSEEKRITLSNGLKVRSKSEAALIEIVSGIGRPYHYDELVRIEFPDGTGKYVSPDLIIKREDGRLIVLEHFGLVSDPAYMANNQEKLKLYSSAGFVPWDNLIITYDRPDGGLDLQLAKAQLLSKM